MFRALLTIPVLGLIVLTSAIAVAEDRVETTDTDPMPWGWREASGAALVHSSGLRCSASQDGFDRFDISGGLLAPAGCAYANDYNIRIRLTFGAKADHEYRRLSAAFDLVEQAEFRWAEAPEHARISAWTAVPRSAAPSAHQVLVIETPDFTLALDFPAPYEGEALEAASRFFQRGLRG